MDPVVKAKNSKNGATSPLLLAVLSGKKPAWSRVKIPAHKPKQHASKPTTLPR